MIHFNILDKKRQKLIPRLAFLKSRGFYLAGGTAMALQLAHRVSVDFDFYNKKDFDAQKLFQQFQKQFAKDDLIQIQVAENTLSVSINNIEVSLFTYKYPLVKPIIKTEYFNLASTEDIGAMKLIAICQRGLKRDFIDIYFLLQELGLDRLLNAAKKKYKGFNKYLALQGLAYFEDADKGSKRRITLFKSVSWATVKKEIIQIVDNFKKINFEK